MIDLDAVEQAIGSGKLSNDVSASSEITVLPSGEVTITQSARLLFTKISSRMVLFARGGAVVHLVRQDDGLTGLEVLRPAAARSLFEKFGRLMAWRVGRDGKPVLKPTHCPYDMADALLQTIEAQTLLPRVTGLINAPIIRESSGVLEVIGPGYDRITGILVTGGMKPPDLDSALAVESLAALLDEFDFQTPGDRSRALASFVTPALKVGGLLKGGVPADVAEADKSQSGKGYRHKIVAAIYGETVALVTHRDGGVGSVDESLNQRLIGGRPFIQFDNFRGRLASQHLEAFLTAEGSFPCRVPHRSEILIQPERFFVMLTSNGVDTTKDFANRSSMIRIKKKPDGFHFRKYPEGDLLAHVRANQAFYLGCVFAVVREWHRQGKLRTDEARHDFREWCQTLDWIIRQAFNATPLMEGHHQAQVRVSNPALVWLRAVTLAIAESNDLGRELTASDIAEICEGGSISVPGLAPGADEATGSRIIGRVLSKLFGNRDQLEVDSFTARRGEKQVKRQSCAGGNYDLKVYIFSRWGHDTQQESPAPQVINSDHEPSANAKPAEHSPAPFESGPTSTTAEASSVMPMPMPTPSQTPSSPAAAQQSQQYV